MYRCKVIFELEPVIKLSVNYYVGDKPIHTFILIKSHKQELRKYPCKTCNIIPPSGPVIRNSKDYWDMWGFQLFLIILLTSLNNFFFIKLLPW